MNQYQMNESEKELFLSGDEGRGTVRQEASMAFPESGSIQVVDSEGNLFDTVTGLDYKSGDDTEPGLAIVLTDEQLEERRTLQALESADLARLEEDLRPKVFGKLKDEARAELRAEYAETIRELRREKLELKAQVIRLTDGVNSLTSKNATLQSEIATLKAVRDEP